MQTRLLGEVTPYGHSIRFEVAVHVLGHTLPLNANTPTDSSLRMRDRWASEEARLER